MPSLDLKDILNTPMLPNYLDAVNKNLVAVAKTAAPGLKKPLLHVVKAKSKRLRPALVLASAGGKINPDVILAGTAIELVHLGSLIHDDIIDKADSRWGKPSVHKSDGPASALLAGDFLLAAATACAAKISTPAAQLISKTIASLINGESYETSDNFNLYRTESSYFKCIQAKTAALISASCNLGGLCAKLNKSQSTALVSYGNNLGISFQLIDDLLDIVSSPELLGKPVGNDAKSGVYTLPVIYSLKVGSHKILKKLLKNPKYSTKDLAQLLITDGSIQKVIVQVNKYNLEAHKCLRGFDNVGGLQNLPAAYFSWVLNNLFVAEYKAKIV